MSDARLHVIVQGLVQGVSFRYFTIRLAERLNLAGWVRNVGKNKVETVAEGKEDSLKAFLSELRIGPSSAKIARVDVFWEKPCFEFQSFRILF